VNFYQLLRGVVVFSSGWGKATSTVKESPVFPQQANTSLDRRPQAKAHPSGLMTSVHE